MFHNNSWTFKLFRKDPTGYRKFRTAYRKVTLHTANNTFLTCLYTLITIHFFPANHYTDQFHLKTYYYIQDEPLNHHPGKDNPVDVSFGS